MNQAGIAYHHKMRGHEFLERVRRIGKKRRISVRIDVKRGKGSHAILYFAGRKATLKDPRKEISPNLLSDMLRQLGLTRRDLF